MRQLLPILLLPLACSTESATPVTVQLSGHAVTFEAATPVRGVQVDIGWDTGLTIAEIHPGTDVAQMNVVRFAKNDEKRTARVLVTDSRKLALPSSGTLFEVEATGTGAIRVISALAADARAASVEVTTH